MLSAAHFMSIADRSILACWGVRGGRAGRPFEVTIDPGGPAERTVDALADAEFVAAGTVIRIRTTGGGGWGDPLERPADLVARDVAWGKVSRAGAVADYGVVITGPPDEPAADEAATRALRERLRAGRPARAPFFDRGPGYPRPAVGRRIASTSSHTSDCHGRWNDKPPNTRPSSRQPAAAPAVASASGPAMCRSRRDAWRKISRKNAYATDVPSPYQMPAMGWLPC